MEFNIWNHCHWFIRNRQATRKATSKNTTRTDIGNSNTSGVAGKRSTPQQHDNWSCCARLEDSNDRRDSTARSLLDAKTCSCLAGSYPQCSEPFSWAPSDHSASCTSYPHQSGVWDTSPSPNPCNIFRNSTIGAEVSGLSSSHRSPHSNPLDLLDPIRPCVVWKRCMASSLASELLRALDSELRQGVAI